METFSNIKLLTTLRNKCEFFEGETFKTLLFLFEQCEFGVTLANNGLETINIDTILFGANRGAEMGHENVWSLNRWHLISQLNFRWGCLTLTAMTLYYYGNTKT